MTLINICSHERLEIFPGESLTLVVVYSAHNPRASVIRLDTDATIHRAPCQPEEDQHGAEADR